MLRCPRASGVFIPSSGGTRRGCRQLTRNHATSYKAVHGVAATTTETRRRWEEGRGACRHRERSEGSVWLKEGLGTYATLLRARGGIGHVQGLPLDQPYLMRQRAYFSSQPAAEAAKRRQEEEEFARSVAAGTAAGSQPRGAGSSQIKGAPASADGTPPRYLEENFKPEELKPEMGIEDPRMEENSPSTMGGIIRRYTLKTFEVLRSIPGLTATYSLWATKAIVNFLIESITNPASLREKWNHIKKVTKEELHHYWVGTKLLWSDIKTSLTILRRLLNGHTLTRRERRQLTRTTADIFRLVPFAFFVIVPFMELLLPVALKVWPNMLPSTYKDNLKEEENMKRDLKMRLALAGFLKDTLQEITKKKAKTEAGTKEGEASALMLAEFVEKARAGTYISTNDINKVARLFKDELTLDNMSRPQLASMCVYMGLRPYGSDNFLRFQLRAKLRGLKEDDQRIVWEGIDNMTKEELREACRERGMRAYGLTQLGYRRQMQQWLNLSINKNVPISLLILSRAFTLDSKFPDPAAAVADSISSLDKDVVNEVLLDVASGAELRSPDIRARKLESIERQNELIEQERKREEARKKKEDEAKKKKDDEQKAADAAAKAAVPTPSPEVTQAAAKIILDTSQAMAAAAASASASDAKTVKDAAHLAAKLTDSLPTPGTAPPPVPKSERLPTETVLSEADIVSQPLPPLTPPSSPAEEGSKEKEGDKAKGPQLSVEEVKALRTLVGQSSVEQEKTALAQLKAELQKAATAKAEEEDDEEDLPIKAAKTPTKAPAAPAAATVTPPEAAVPVKSIEGLLADVAKAAERSKKEEAADGADGSLKAAKPAAAEKTPEPATQQSKLDKSIEKMRTKVASMLDRLEVDIEKVESTIGDKLHMLDKDKDGVLSTAELSEVILHVLKRHTSEEEALKIAATFDKDADGILTVQELLDWIEHREELLDELAGDNETSADAVEDAVEEAATNAKAKKPKEKADAPAAAEALPPTDKPPKA